MDKAERERQEALVDQYISDRKTTEAIRLLVELIEAYAGEQDFVKAEALHDKLYEADPMALDEIVRTGEFIEKQKSAGVDRQHLDVWSDLYGRLSTLERNALYYSMKAKEYEPGETIMDQGTFNKRLYFIDKGAAKAIYRHESREILIITLGEGHIFGQESFFSATVGTVSIIPLSRMKLNYINRDVLKKWKTDVPALESRLYDYCAKHDSVKTALDRQRMERRAHKRVDLSTTMVFQLVDKNEKPVGKEYKGVLSDLSAGGMSFVIRSSRKESVQSLLGRRLRLKFELPLRNGRFRKVDQNMTVIAAQQMVFDDYSLHLKFDIKWHQKMIDEIDTSRMVPKDSRYVE